MKQNAQDSSGVKVPPPLIYALVFVVGLAFHFIFPVDFLPFGWVQLLAIGLPIGGIAVGLALWAVWTMRQAATTFSVYQPTTTIVTQGAYRFSRNPAYLSLTIVYIGTP